MAKAYKIYTWKKAPMLRLLFPFIVGIILEFYFPFRIRDIIISASATISIYTIFRLLPLRYRFKLQQLGGAAITAFMIIAGIFLTWQKDIRNHKDWYGNRCDSSYYIVATISEPLVDKNKSFKALANVEEIIKKDSVYVTTGKLLLYFSKDSGLNTLTYGNRIIIKKTLQVIKNSGNPAAFDYKRYCATQQIFYQCYLKKNDWLLLRGNDATFFKRAIFNTQHFVINALDKYISGDDEKALAKALLIGYKVDLDKDLVQAYSNAGVIHLIVIAGLHLGLIYALLLFVTGLIPFLKNSKIARVSIILVCLWFFALVTGASPPVLRAVVMFSFIATGKAFNKNASIFNSLASSAFILLCYDPFILKDAGFQLSYFAVTSIVLSQRYVFNWFYFKNKLARKIWELASVSISAQVFTLPACLYYFHQVPLLFIFSNIVAIPLAAFALWGCLILVVISPLRIVALYLGKVITTALWLLNHIVLFINALPFSVWGGFSISITETILLYLVFGSFLYWLIRKNRAAFKLGVSATLLFTTMVVFKKWNSFQQKRIIVYNIPAHKAIDFISGNRYDFIGDSDLIVEGLLQNFNLKPGRISMVLHKNEENTFPFFKQNYFCQFYEKRILMIDSGLIYKPRGEKMNVDYIIISKNPKIIISDLANAFNCSLYIFDASNSLWKIDKWKKGCEELHLRFYSVPEQGAFITDL